jgi:hypothetical protein
VYGSEREEEDGGGNGRRMTAKIVTVMEEQSLVY